MAEQEDYQERMERERKAREKKYEDMSTKEKAVYRNLEAEFEVEKQIGAAQPQDKEWWIKARMYGKR